MLAEPESKTFCAAAPRPSDEGMKKGRDPPRRTERKCRGRSDEPGKSGKPPFPLPHLGRFDGVFLKKTLRSSALFASRNGANRAVFTYGLGKPLKYANSAGAGLALNAQSSRRRGSEAVVLGANSQSSHQGQPRNSSDGTCFGSSPGLPAEATTNALRFQFFCSQNWYMPANVSGFSTSSRCQRSRSRRK
jgi:hypothetical protein